MFIPFWNYHPQSKENNKNDINERKNRETKEWTNNIMNGVFMMSNPSLAVMNNPMYIQDNNYKQNHFNNNPINNVNQQLYTPLKNGKLNDNETKDNFDFYNYEENTKNNTSKNEYYNQYNNIYKDNINYPNFNYNIGNNHFNEYDNKYKQDKNYFNFQGNKNYTLNNDNYKHSNTKL